eukprot:3518899-Prorocentrum_lima.AAC.1
MADTNESMEHDDDVRPDEEEATSETVWTYISKERILKNGQQTNNYYMDDGVLRYRLLVEQAEKESNTRKRKATSDAKKQADVRAALKDRLADVVETDASNWVSPHASNTSGRAAGAAGPSGSSKGQSTD